nr:hypothetical protein [Candidatus Sigynarchaeum springense]
MFVLDVTPGTDLDVTVLRASPSISVTITLCYMELDLDNAFSIRYGSPSDTSLTLICDDLPAGTWYVHIGATGNTVDSYDIEITTIEP